MEMGYAQYPRWKNAGTALMLITLELAERTARLLQQMAERTGRPADAIARELIDRGVAEAPIEVLPDDEVMALAEMAMSDADQQALADLLDDQREGELDGAGRERLAALMQVYRRGMVRKSEALKAAVLRGLLPPLG
jgi:predicted DNA-binding protein